MAVGPGFLLRKSAREMQKIKGLHERETTERRSSLWDAQWSIDRKGSGGTLGFGLCPLLRRPIQKAEKLAYPVSYCRYETNPGEQQDSSAFFIPMPIRIFYHRNLVFTRRFRRPGEKVRPLLFSNRQEGDFLVE